MGDIMSLMNLLKKTFEKEVGVPTIMNLGNKFQVMNASSFIISYGSTTGGAPSLPPIQYETLFPKTYYFNGFQGSKDEDFEPHQKDIIKLSFNCFADAMERYVLNDNPMTINKLTSADELVIASDNFGYSHYESCISLELFKLATLKKTIFHNRLTIQAVCLPYRWNYLDGIIPFFSHTQRNLTKAIVYKVDESFVLSDVKFEIDVTHKILKLSFLIGASDKNNIKVFDLA